MVRSNNLAKFHQFRNEFPFFVFEDQEIMLDERGLSIRFIFNLADKHTFYPSLFIPRKACFLPDKEISDILPWFVFHIGMIEMVSYWKATCSPLVIVKPFGLEQQQLTWWSDLYFHGLGEFRYLNGIDITEDSLMELQVARPGILSPAKFPLKEEVIIPVGGGKDSVVTLELLGDIPGSIPLILNPRGATLNTLRTKNIHNSGFIEVQRVLDPQLLDLNNRGFLNGHTPFSALLGFISVLASAITGKKYIALSNETSANEPTIPGTDINHQYSKSLRYEGLFRDYIKKYLHRGISWFSFLRPLNELQIASLFAQYKQYHHVFRSCNAGSKTDSWCGQCPKCLFAWIILSPFLSRHQLTDIFGRNLADDPSLIPILDQLTGEASEKPFECVGTINEVRAALDKTIYLEDRSALPELLKHYINTRAYTDSIGDSFRDVMDHLQYDHHVPTRFFNLLTEAFYGNNYLGKV
jgi:hypothetical protein